MGRRLCQCTVYFPKAALVVSCGAVVALSDAVLIELINNKFHWLLPTDRFVSSSGGFASLSFDQVVPKNSHRHLADPNAICILH